MRAVCAEDDDDALWWSAWRAGPLTRAMERRCISRAVEVEPQLRARVHLVHVLASRSRRAAELPVECARCEQGVEGAAAICAEGPQSGRRLPTVRTSSMDRLIVTARTNAICKHVIVLHT